MSAEPNLFDGWAIVELMGHTRMAGKVTEEEHFGAKLGRIDIPKPDGGCFTQFFSGSSLFRLTPTTEEIARRAAAGGNPEPVSAWELRLPAPKQEAEPDELYAPEDEPINDDDD